MAAAGPWSPAVTPPSPLSLMELESQVWCLEKEATELKEAVEQQKVKNNVSVEGPPAVWMGRGLGASPCPVRLLPVAGLGGPDSHWVGLVTWSPWSCGRLAWGGL